MVMHVSWRWKKSHYSWRSTHTNMRGLTLVWWFTSASLMRRSSTIWSWPILLAINNAVWPSCTCKGEQDRPESWTTIPPTTYTVKYHTSMTIVKPRQNPIHVIIHDIFSHKETLDQYNVFSTPKKHLHVHWMTNTNVHDVIWCHA